ncbi:hypothetical protein [Thiomicrorhabdus lithotrophica]|uniref:FtsX-like permease family protein n=1 Tax=Thiomicrorhabdus lithotrophica TaxID=2949997 RepID=A0ABY8C784_9GAMM|nr:hypothetical protein [Thiomicrorhabdus lithotrophica]WEJ61823.1 hypothetical protein NR989_07320 [Thiomicrorhabdus lithotrophica]
MTEQMAFTLSSASTGFVAAICFCIGSAFLNRKKIIVLSSTYWGYNEAQAKALISQSVQYLIGAFFLIVAFALQIVATQASQNELHLPHPALESPYTFVVVIFLSCSLLAYVIFRGLLLRQPSILKELQEK